MLHASQAYAQISVHNWLVDMQFIHRIRDTFIPKAFPREAECSQASNRLAEKLAIQIQWMQERGIDIKLKESERPRPAKGKRPLPGTVIYFSRNSQV